MILWLLLFSLLLILSSPPFLVFPLSLIAFLPLIHVARRNYGRKLKLAFVFILPYFLFHLHWIVYLEEGRALGFVFYLGVLLLVLVKSFVFALWFRVYNFSKTAFWFALSYVLYEKSLTFLGDLSFPWAFLSYSALGFLPFAQFASVLGMYFLSFAIMFFNHALYEAILEKRFSNMIVATLLVLLPSFYGWFYMNHKELPKGYIKVAVAQPNVLPRSAYDPKEFAETYEAFMDIARMLKGKEYDIAIFSESAVPGLVSNFHTRRFLMEFLDSLGKPILIGLARKDGYFYNTAFLLDTNYHILGFYDKIKIVPFGENLPFYEHLPTFIRNMNLGQGNYHRGNSVEPISFGNSSLGVLICYESIFPEMSKEHVSKGANLLVVITNDGWFGPSIGPMEHFEYARMRAIETHRYLVRSAKTGISAIIDAHGRIESKIDLFRRGVLVSDVPILEDRTPYTYIGDTWILILVASGFIILAIRKLPR